jgi:predicted permease
MLLQDLRHTIRRLRREPVVVAWAAATLGGCIAANTIVFSLVNSILLRPLPYPRSEHISWVTEHIGNEQMELVTGADYYSILEQNRVFEDVAAFETSTTNWSGLEKPEQLETAQVTASFFRVMAAPPMLGRYFTTEEQGAPVRVAVASYSFWRHRLNSDPSFLGKTVTLDRAPYVLIGVMAQGFDFPRGTDLWLPLPMNRASQLPRAPGTPMRMLSVVARLKPGVGRAAMEGEMRRLTETIRAEYPPEFEKAGFLKGMAVLAVPLQERVTGDLRRPLLVLGGAVGLVLLIGCVNLANLMLARASARRREFAVRLALGSDRGRIVRQLLLESIALALPAGAVGASVALFAVRALNATKPMGLDRHPEISLDSSTLAFTVGLTLITGLIFGMASALETSRLDIQEALKTSGQTYSGGTRSARVRRVLLVAELSVSLVLLIGSGLLGRSFLNLSKIELGFLPDHLLSVRVNLAGAVYATGEAQVHFHDEVLRRVRALPMVRSAAVSTDLPLSGELGYGRTSFQVAGRAPLPRSQWPATQNSVVSRDYFKTMGIALKSGRLFEAGDTRDAPVRIVVNEAFARRIFPGEDPLGQRILGGMEGAIQWTIVGVVGNTRGSTLGAEPSPMAYVCNCQRPSRFLARMRLIVRTTGDPRAAIGPVSEQVYAVDREQPVFDVKTMDARVAESLAPARFQLVLIGSFTTLAMILGAAGLYGVISYLVSRRTREIAIRIALGARPSDVIRLVLAEGIALVPPAIVAGLAASWALTRSVESMLYGVAPLDGPTFVVMPLILTMVAAAAAWVPAHRAARLKPIEALSAE